MTETSKTELAKPLLKEHVKERDGMGGSGKLSYIEGHTAIREANRIFGFDGWVRELLNLRVVQEEQVDLKWRVSYMATVRVTTGGVLRDGTGFGQGIDKDLGKAHESASKECETDAMKRAMMAFGDPFGLALYDKKQEHVDKETKAPDSIKDGDPWLIHIGMKPEWIDTFKGKCSKSGLNYVDVATKARGAQVRSVTALNQYLNDIQKRELTGAEA